MKTKYKKFWTRHSLAMLSYKIGCMRRECRSEGMMEKVKTLQNVHDFEERRLDEWVAKQ